MLAPLGLVTQKAEMGLGPKDSRVMGSILNGLRMQKHVIFYIVVVFKQLLFKTTVTKPLFELTHQLANKTLLLL